VQRTAVNDLSGEIIQVNAPNLIRSNVTNIARGDRPSPKSIVGGSGISKERMAGAESQPLSEHNEPQDPQ
jgi:hypothetical protein